MNCFLCKKEIEEKSNYFKFTEMNNKKEVNTDYAHKICWDTFKSQLNGANASLKKSNELLSGMGNYMRKMGIIPEQEMVLT